MKPPAGVQLRPMAAGQWPGVERIYRQGVAGGLATFESAVPSWEDFSARKIAQLGLVAVDRDGAVIGWIAASPVSARWAYRGVIEHSVYVDAAQAGRGVGTALLGALGARARARGYWTIQCAIFAENHASRALHRKAGFREVGYRERIAQVPAGPLAGQWIDTVLYELRLEPGAAAET